MLTPMKRYCCVVFVAVLGLAARAADATTPIDYTQRNAPFAPAPAAPPPKQSPEVNATVQRKRVEPPTIEKPAAALGDRRAPLAVEETRAKTVREKQSRRPEGEEQPISPFNHKPAPLTTDASTTKPATVAKYQDSLAAATPWGPGAASGNTPRFSAADPAAAAKINRFVFRKNPAEPAPSAPGAPVTPAAGGSPVPK